MQVSYSEGLANHADRESCGSAREGVAEALTAERIGQPLSREKPFIPDADALDNAEGNIGWSDIASATRSGVVRDPGHVWKLLARDPGDLGFSLGAIAGSHREDEESKPMMHESEKSDSAIVAGKLANKTGSPVAESMEPRAETMGNARRQSTRRAHDWYHKDDPTFSDAIAAVRRLLWGAPNLSMSRHDPDRVEIPIALWKRLTETLCYAA